MGEENWACGPMGALEEDPVPSTLGPCGSAEVGHQVQPAALPPQILGAHRSFTHTHTACSSSLLCTNTGFGGGVGGGSMVLGDSASQTTTHPHKLSGAQVLVLRFTSFSLG